MFTSQSLHYPVKIEQEGNGMFRATLIDMPGGPEGWGYNENTAIRQLSDKAIPMLNELRLSGKPVSPSAVGDNPTLMVGPMVAINATTPPAGQVQPSGGTMNYSWTDKKPSGGA